MFLFSKIKIKKPKNFDVGNLIFLRLILLNKDFLRFIIPKLPVDSSFLKINIKTLVQKLINEGF